MTEVKATPLYLYHFFKQPDSRWMMWDQFGTDLLVDERTVAENIIPSLCQAGACVLEGGVYQVDNVNIEVASFGKIQAQVKLYVTDNVITKAQLLTEGGYVIHGDLKQFELRLPYFEGTPWPYTESEQVELVEADR